VGPVAFAEAARGARCFFCGGDRSAAGGVFHRSWLDVGVSRKISSQRNAVNRYAGGHPGTGGRG
jgi:hypothetical protein